MFSEILYLNHLHGCSPTPELKFFLSAKKSLKHGYEVDFLDISLPGMDGVELKHKLTRKGGDFPIVIAITSHDSEVDKNYFTE